MPGLNRSRRRSLGPTFGGSSLIQVRGAERLAEVSKALRQAGQKDLRNEMTRGLRRSARPLIADARQHARNVLPEHGGLNERVARSKFRVSVRGGGQRASVRITATGLDARVDRTGRVRHPVYGKRDTWVTQQVPRGWFTEPMEAGAPRVRRQMLIALTELAKKLERA